MKLFIERQCDLVICKLKKDDAWFFSACYRGVRQLVGFDFPPGSAFELDLEATNIKEVGMPNDKGITEIKVSLEVLGGESPSSTVFSIKSPNMAVVTEIQVAIAELGKQFAMKHK